MNSENRSISLRMCRTHRPASASGLARKGVVLVEMNPTHRIQDYIKNEAVKCGSRRLCFS